MLLHKTFLSTKIAPWCPQSHCSCRIRLRNPHVPRIPGGAREAPLGRQALLSRIASTAAVSIRGSTLEVPPVPGRLLITSPPIGCFGACDPRRQQGVPAFRSGRRSQDTEKPPYPRRLLDHLLLGS